MQALLKFTLLAFAFCLNLFSIQFNESTLSGSRDEVYHPCIISNSCFSRNDFTFLGSYVKLGNEIYKVERKFEKIFNLANLKQQGSFFVPQQKSWVSYHVLLNYDSSFEKASIVCRYDEQFKSLGDCSYSYKEGKGYKKIELSYYEEYYLSGPIATCGDDENFNTSTGKCQKCPDGQSWNQNANSCFVDCTDDKTNKYGWADGSCTDCSAAKTVQEIYSCFCGSLGLGVPETLTDVGVIGKPGYFLGKCSNGYSFEYKDPDYKPDTPKPDDNKTKPGSGNNNGGDKDKDKDKDKDNDKDLCKKNPNDPKCKKNDNNTTVPGPSDDNPKFNSSNFDDSNVEKERSSLYGGIVKHINDNLSKFDGIRDGINQFISNVQLKGFEKVQPSIKGKCPIKKQISLPGGKSQEIVVDYCENLSPVSEISYYAFYIGFAVGGFILLLKLIIFSI